MVFLSGAGKLFQTLGDAAAKDLSPRVLNFVCEITSIIDSVELTSSLNISHVFQVCWTMSLSALNVSNKPLHSICSFIGKQCNSLDKEVISAYFRATSAILLIKK